MKKTLRLISIALLLPLVLSAQRTIKVNQHTEQKNEIKTINQRSDEMTIELGVNEMISRNVSTDTDMSEIYYFEDGSFIKEKGAPNLGKLSASYEIPNSGKMGFEIIESNFVDYKNIEIAPSKGILYRDQDPSKVPFVKGKVYQEDSFFPQKLVQLNEPYILNEKRGQAVWFYPLQYNPVSKVLRVYTKIKIRYYKVSENGVNELIPDNGKNSSLIFDQIYQEHFKNYHPSRYVQLPEFGKMLIVAYDAYASEMSDFTAWKKQRGLEVELIKFSTIGTTATQLKDYVKNYYNTKGLTFLLLVGDSQHIPSLNKSGDSDPAYGHINGTDSYAEVIVGRFSAQSINDVKTQVQRSIYYEKSISESDNWLDKAAGIASDEGGPQGDNGETDIQHMDNIRNDLTSFGYSNVDKFYDPGASATALGNNLNKGRSLINYVGHGSDYAFVTTGFNRTHINNLTNENKLPFIFDVACVNGNFHGKTCFAETWLRATNNNQPTGAVAIIASTINQSWAPPMNGQDAMVDLLVHSVNNNIKRTFGGITVNGIMQMNDKYGSSGAEMANTWTIFGDPSLIVRNRNPKKMVVSYDKNITTSTKSLEVSCDSDGAHVCLSQNGNIIGKAVVNSGKASLALTDLTNTKDLLLTIVGQDKVSFIEKVEGDSVITEPVIVLSKHSIAGDNNNNAQADFGETFELNFELKNTGMLEAKNVRANLIVSDKYSIPATLNATLSFGDIKKDSVANNKEVLTVKLTDYIPDGHNMEFKLKLSADNIAKDREEIVKVKLNAPILTHRKISYNDDFTGNSVNGIIDAGESGELIVELENSGHAQLNSIITTLNANDAAKYFTFSNPNDTISQLKAAEKVTLKYKVDVSKVIPVEYKALFTSKAQSGDYQSVDSLETICNYSPEFVMKNGVETVSSGMFYDAGGKNARYTNYENYTLTFLPQDTNRVVSVTFSYFDVERGYDFLKVYNSKTKDASQLIGSYDGYNHNAIGTNGVVTANNPDGALTFAFTSDYSVVNNGWVAKVSLSDRAREQQDITSVEKSEVASAIRIYPNPAANLLSIENANYSKLNLVDITGRIIKSSQVLDETKTIDVSDVANGTYLLLIENKKGTSVHEVVIAK